MASVTESAKVKARMRPSRTTWACASALFASALLFFLGTGLSPIAGLTWLAPLPLLLLAPRVRARTALVVTAVSYVLSTVPTWSFYAQSSDTPLWPIGTLIILAFTATLTASVWIFRRLVVRGLGLAAALSAPAMWTGVLYLISVSNPMGIVGTLATTQADIPPVVSIVAVTGWTGLEFLIFFVPTAIAAVLAPGIMPMARARTGAAAILIAGLAFGSGPLLATGNDEPERRVAAIAHNHSPWGVDVATPQGHSLLDSYNAAISALPDGVDTAVLPEGAFAVDDSSLATLTSRLARTAQAQGIDLVAAYVRTSHGTKFNTARLFPANGSSSVSYLKHHDLTSQLGTTLTHQPGTSNRVGIEICNDVSFPQPNREYAASGARSMLIPAADNGRNGWQHSRTALLRGAENGFSVAWAGRDGQLMIAGADGRVHADAATNGPDAVTTVVADVADGPGATPYTRYGDWFAWLTIAIGAAGIVVSWLRRSQTARQHQR